MEFRSLSPSRSFKMPPLSPQRLIAIGAAVFLILLFLFTATHQDAAPIRAIKDSAQSTVDHICSNDHQPNFGQPSFQSSIAKLYESIKHPVNADLYKDAYGKEFKVSDDAVWKKPLGNQILIVDMDTRVPNKTNELLNEEKLNWETLDASQDGGMVSASFLNHYLYAQIHGYDYRFFQAQHLVDMRDTWIKPHVLLELLEQYKFVIFIDADATIQHLEVPLEWLFNRWDIGLKTSIAMPIDTRQLLNGNNNTSGDSKGKTTLNTGFIVAQNLPLTFDMLKAWVACPDGKKYKDCGMWKDNWSHEQRAFSEYIRYDYNPSKNNIVEIPCDEAMGYPGLHQKHPHIQSDCTGQFVRHHTVDKDLTKSAHANAVLQNLAEVMQKNLLANADELWIKEGQETKSFMKEFKDKSDHR